MKKLIIASTSTVHGKEYLEYILPELSNLFKGINEILFIPYARPSGLTFDEYTVKAKKAFEKIAINVVGIHEYDNEVDAVNNAKGIFIGGGNTFLLLKTLYEKKIVSVIKNVVENSIPYFGTSAGSNITGLTIQNTNDMPIVYPPTFQSFGFLNFNLNPHYLDPDNDSKHMGESRATRIKEFHCFNAIPVLGLREGSWLQVTGNQVILKGDLHARLFQQHKAALETPPDTNLTFLM